MTIDMKDEIQKMIQAQVQEELKKSMLNSTAKVEEDECKTIHHGFSCDNCGKNPIVGVRFHSLIKQNYDLCSKCEKIVHQEHPMIRFRHNTHRGLGHSKGWTKLNRIMTSHGNRGIFGGCARRHRRQNHPQVFGPENVVEFFTNGIFGGVKKADGAGEKIKQHFKKAAQSMKKEFKKAEEKIKKVEKQIKEKTSNRGRANLCHIRTRDAEPVEKSAFEAPLVERHPRFQEFKKVFTNVEDDQLDAFLRDNESIQDDNTLYNEAIAKFLN